MRSEATGERTSIWGRENWQELAGGNWQEPTWGGRPENPWVLGSINPGPPALPTWAELREKWVSYKLPLLTLPSRHLDERRAWFTLRAANSEINSAW